MRLDASIAFIPVGGALSLVAGAGVAVQSGIIDLMGVGVGVAPPNIIGNATVWGTDFGIGMDKIQLLVSVGTAFTTATAATLNVQLQGAPDAGTPTYQPGTWQTFVETGTLTAAQLAANTIIARFDWPPAVPVSARPRFMRLNFVVPAATDFTAGTIQFALPTPARDDYAIKYQNSNYAVH